MTCLGGVLVERTFHYHWTEKTQAWWTSGDRNSDTRALVRWSVLFFTVLCTSWPSWSVHGPVLLWNCGDSQLGAGRLCTVSIVSYKLSTVQANTRTHGEFSHSCLLDFSARLLSSDVFTLWSERWTSDLVQPPGLEKRHSAALLSVG